MQFRPRYSLLTLLLLTAAIAVGVKLWRGPHHVVDRTNPQMEDEYTYYRYWDGTKIMDGVRVLRYSPQGKHDRSSVYYYRQGQCLVAPKSIRSDTAGQRLSLEALAKSYSILNAEELTRFQMILLQELEQFNTESTQ
jgi:hypothetical protein